MSNLDAILPRVRPLNGIPQSDTLLNYIPESPDFGRNLFQQAQQLAQLQQKAVSGNQLQQISPFLQINNPMINAAQFELPGGSSHNLQPHNPIQQHHLQFQQLAAANQAELEQQQLLNLLKLPQQNINMQQLLLNQMMQQQQLNNGQQGGQAAPSLLQSQQLQQVQQQQQQQQLQQQQQQMQQQQQQQAQLQQNNAQAYNQLLMQLGLLNSPHLIQQLLQIISNPLELPRFQGNLLRIQQQAAQATQNFQQIQLPHQIAAMGGLPQLPPNLTGINNVQNTVTNTVATTNQNLQQKLIHQQKQKEELTNMLEFLVEKMHQTDTDQIFEKKREFKYLQGDDQTIFDNIVHKYQFSKKTKEEMIKYILRKCFKFLKSQKDIEVAFTRKYFGNEMGSQQQLQIQKQFLQSENNLGGYRRAANKDSDDSDDQLDTCKVKEEQVDNVAKEIGSVNNLNSTKNLPNVSANNLDSEDVDKVMPFKQIIRFL